MARGFSLFLLFCTLLSTNLFAQESTSESLVANATKLIDSWNGPQEPLVEAAQLLFEALNLNPENASAYAQLARATIKAGYKSGARVNAKFHEGTLDRATSFLDQALKIDPNHGKSLVLYGHVAMLQDKLDLARKMLTRADTLDLSDPYLHINWADVLLKAGESDAAAKRYLTITESGTKNRNALSSAYSGLRFYYWNNQEWDKVDEVFVAYLELNPSNSSIHAAYAQFLLAMRSEDVDKALSHAEKGVAGRPHPKWVEIYFVALCTKRNSLEDKVQREVYESKAIAINPTGCD